MNFVVLKGSVMKCIDGKKSEEEKFKVVPYLSFPYTSRPAVAYSHENVRVCVCVCVCVCECVCVFVSQLY